MRANGLLVVVAFSLAACADDQPLALQPSTDEHADPVELRLTLRTASGAFICDGLPNGTEFGVGLHDANPDDGYSSDTVVCPARVARFMVEPGALYSATLEAEDPSWLHPRFVAKMDTIQVTSDTTIVFRATKGRVVGGMATLDGAPLQGDFLLGLRANGIFFEGFGLRSASADSLGRWIDRQTGEPFRLQTGVSYARECQPDHGMRLIAGPDPDAYAVYPADWGAVNCRFGYSRRPTHTATNLQITPEAGEIDPDFGDAVNGYGFGVAYPTGGEPTLGQNLIRDAKLLFAIDQYSQIWTPWDQAGVTGCSSSNPVSCAMYVRSGGPNAVSEGDGLRVRFEMADSGAGDSRVQVVQTSWDGAYGDYVLYKVTFRNTSEDHLTVYPAWHIDWNLTDDFGATDVADVSDDARLISVTDGTRWLGSYLVAPSPVRARYVAQCCGIHGGNDFPASLAWANDVMRGFIISYGLGPTDLTATHGTILHIPVGATRTFWFALLGADSQAGLEAVAALAASEADIRKGGGTP